MSGHSHWAGIKHKKEITDAKRGKVFSKLLAAVSAAAKSEPNPDFNPRLRAAIEKARAAAVPQENIERAVKRASEAGAGIEELAFEAYGPGGAAIVVSAVSDNKNRTVQEIKMILKEHGGKWAEAGSVRWAFEAPAGAAGVAAGAMGGGAREWKAKFPQKLSPEDAAKLASLVAALNDNDDVQWVVTNADAAA